MGISGLSNMFSFKLIRNGNSLKWHVVGFENECPLQSQESM